MPRRRSATLKRGTLLVAAAGCCLGMSAAGVRAGDEDGLGGLLGRLFGAPQRPAAVEPMPETIQRAPRFSEGRRLRIRYAALPKSDTLRPDLSGRQTPLDLSQGPAAAFMKDETLRPGDIVVLKDGARVFSGGRGKRHTAGDFEPAAHSRAIDGKTRRQLAGMVGPAGSVAPDAAKRVVVRLQRPAPAPEPARADLSPTTAGAMRVINPWVATR